MPVPHKAVRSLEVESCGLAETLSCGKYRIHLGVGWWNDALHDNALREAMKRVVLEPTIRSLDCEVNAMRDTGKQIVPAFSEVALRKGCKGFENSLRSVRLSRWQLQKSKIQVISEPISRRASRDGVKSGLPTTCRRRPLRTKNRQWTPIHRSAVPQTERWRVARCRESQPERTRAFDWSR